VWQYDYLGDLRAVDVAVRRLREKIEHDSAKPEHINDQTRRRLLLRAVKKEPSYEQKPAVEIHLRYSPSDRAFDDGRQRLSDPGCAELLQG
jgi:hypothetical protein